MRDIKNELPCRSDSTEAEANAFAARLLCPLCVLQFLNVSSAKEISEFCNVGYTAAKVRFERLCQIRRRSSKRNKEKGHGTFLIEGYERLVLENFKEYIENNKLPDKRESDGN